MPPGKTVSRLCTLERAVGRWSIHTHAAFQFSRPRPSPRFIFYCVPTYTIIPAIKCAKVKPVQLHSDTCPRETLPSYFNRTSVQVFTNTMADAVDFSIAVRPNDIGAVPEIVKGIVDKASALSPGDETARHALLIQARSLVQALETPRETMTKHTWAQVRLTLSKLVLGNFIIWIMTSWAWTQVWSRVLMQGFGN